MSARRTVHVEARLVATRPAGHYQYMTFTAPGLPDLAKPGQFVGITVGGQMSGALLRRSFALHAVSPAADRSEEDILDIVVSPAGKGTDWLANLEVGSYVDLVGPLGRAFPLPRERVNCVLVGGGYGSAPLFWLAAALRERGCHVEFILGAATNDRLFGADKAERYADGVTIVTDDGSRGQQGWVSDPLPEVIRRSDASVVYACGPMGMLESVTRVAGEMGVIAQVSVEEAMACGIGVCMTCTMPVTGSDGVTRMVRSCVEGPTFRGDRVRWDAWNDGYCQVPADAVGAPGNGGH
ncbi:dihydroorotate dehydrogenase electron transfer subunit [Dermatophilus congolensis]|uniref:Dihydrdoorotate oxidase B, electron transfer subunit n=1 Tax=Dermatophilus congolensis TaxID=1863 RepID=A0AA46BMA3_9MICO|nr:dihydroorotate dehydrogenase electron transfer subunit [Dermatophilus congolensis]MBO3129014.1 dihydroorotate dehydrogenase electron transfer subunit [Dermatophilus congolensis]MBO3132349.1 dihydroorotate dehydrogenase electron transfer subunit [Dermatophilus congolensis]MBO3133490.1 dihydroorotate dehydrogenase electron transfer subunit [Dermatophilus congolensis]MBO3135724.1 dihydroorotate dehydrogenase electron transfer subunit [Dermatophilus congolensis]MBO3137963.1 dihydroorotate dehyd